MGAMMRRIYLGEKKRGVEKDGRPPRISNIASGDSEAKREQAGRRKAG